MMKILIIFFTLTLKDEQEKKVKSEYVKHQDEFRSPLNFPSFMQGEVRNERFEIEGVNRVC